MNMKGLTLVRHTPQKRLGTKTTWERVKEYRPLLLMLIPGAVFFLLFNYFPMYGTLIAFKDYKFSVGVWGSEWVGLKYFRKAFSDPMFLQALWNTLYISILKIFFTMVASIVFALLLNELRSARFKKLTQTVSFLPYFMSWIVLGSVFVTLFSLDGPINAIVQFFGGEAKSFLTDETSFIVIVVLTHVWKNFGWSAIIFIAGLAGIDQEMYEAAVVDGANRWERILYITLPSLIPVIVIQTILNVSGILNAGLDQMYVMQNASVLNVAEVLDTYVYKLGLQGMEYSYSTAIGLFKSLVGLIMVLITNKIANKLGGKDSALW